MLLYGAEAWVLYRKQLRRLEQFHQRCLRSILGIKWQDYISNEEVLTKAHIPSLESIILQLQLGWAGHVARMDDTRIPKAMLFGELSAGKRNQGGPKKRYKDQLKSELEMADVCLDSWQQEAQNRDSWRSNIRNASKRCRAREE